jgi:hypothetical protein
MSWWLPDLQPALSQGDVLLDCVAGAAVVHPRQAVKRASLAGAADAWVVDPAETPDQNDILTLLAKGRISAALVVSHSCELDKGERKARVHVAEVRPMASLQPDARERIMSQSRISLMPLPDLPTLGDCYADLRTIGGIDRRAALAAPKVASMTDAAVARLQAQLVAFFTRLKLDASVP